MPAESTPRYGFSTRRQERDRLRGGRTSQDQVPPRPLLRRILLAAIAGALMLAGATASAQNLVIINKLDDLDHGSWSGIGDLTQTSRHCVASNAPGNLYSITITGDGPGGAFEARNGPATLPYIVLYRDDPSDGFVPVTAGVSLTNQVGRSNLKNCPAQKQEVRVRFLAADLIAAPAGTYTGTLTLLVAPM